MKVEFNYSQQAANQAFLDFVRQVKTAAIDGLVGYEATVVHGVDPDQQANVLAYHEATEVTYVIKGGEFPRRVTIHLMRRWGGWDPWKLIDDRYQRPSIHIRMPYHICPPPYGGSTTRFIPIHVSEDPEENCQVSFGVIVNLRSALLDARIREL